MPNRMIMIGLRFCLWFSLCFGLGLLAVSADVRADIVEQSADHYRLRHEALSPTAPAALWARLINPAEWWHPDHTYSGSSANLSLKAVAGAPWREDWDGGSVIHGTVLYVKEGEQLRLDAPFGPLLEMAVTVVWTITIEATEGGGSKIIFDEIANGTGASALDKVAPAVDFVKTEAITRLAAAP